MVALCGFCAYLKGQWTLANWSATAPRRFFATVAPESPGSSTRACLRNLGPESPGISRRALAPLADPAQPSPSAGRPVCRDEPGLLHHVDRPAGGGRAGLGRPRASPTMSEWSREGYHVQHNDAALGRGADRALRGNGAGGLGLDRPVVAGAARSLLLRVQFIRTSMHFLRARAALAAAVSATPFPGRNTIVSGRRPPRRRRLDRERMRCPTAYARLVRGALAAIDGDSSRAVSLLPRPSHASRRSTCAFAPRQLAAAWENSWAATGQERSITQLAGCLIEKIKNPARMASMIITPWTYRALRRSLLSCSRLDLAESRPGDRRSGSPRHAVLRR